MSYLNSVTLVGFVGADPEQRQARNNGSKFTVLSVATQRSWKNAEDEWTSKTEWHRVCCSAHGWPSMCSHHQERRARARRRQLVSSTYERRTAKARRPKTTKITSWSIRADVVRKLDRGEPEPEAALAMPSSGDQR